MGDQISHVGRQSTREWVEMLREAPLRPSKRRQWPKGKTSANDEGPSCRLLSSLPWRRRVVLRVGCPLGAEVALPDQYLGLLAREKASHSIEVRYSGRALGILPSRPAISGREAARLLRAHCPRESVCRHACRRDSLLSDTLAIQESPSPRNAGFE